MRYYNPMCNGQKDYEGSEHNSGYEYYPTSYGTQEKSNLWNAHNILAKAKEDQSVLDLAKSLAAEANCEKMNLLNNNDVKKSKPVEFPVKQSPSSRNNSGSSIKSESGASLKQNSLGSQSFSHLDVNSNNTATQQVVNEAQARIVYAIS